MNHPKKFFTEEEKGQLLQAIEEAERMTSGEIRVHLASKSDQNPTEEAKALFEKLKMTETKERNGILFFLSLQDHQFVILGDQGIHQKVNDHFWDEIRDLVVQQFKNEKFAEGLIAGIQKCGEKLALYFPRKKNDRNELSNEISGS